MGWLPTWDPTKRSALPRSRSILGTAWIQYWERGEYKGLAPSFHIQENSAFKCRPSKLCRWRAESHLWWYLLSFPNSASSSSQVLITKALTNKLGTKMSISELTNTTTLSQKPLSPYFLTRPHLWLLSLAY